MKTFLTAGFVLVVLVTLGMSSTETIKPPSYTVRTCDGKEYNNLTLERSASTWTQFRDPEGRKLSFYGTHTVIAH